MSVETTESGPLMKIYVRRRHIEKGRRRDSSDCPVALAAGEVAGREITALTGIIRIGRETFDLPRIARRFIARFDSGKPVKPFAFTIRA